MFYAIRRMIKFAVLLFFAGVAVVVYQHRHHLEPVAIWYEVWDNGGLKQRDPLPVISGTASTVLDSRTFYLQRARMPLFSIRLVGLDEPNLTPTTTQAAKAEAEKKKVLRELIQGKVVNIEVTYHANNSGLGICHIGTTNINLHLIRQGHAQLKPEYIKTLPAQVQYEFFKARRISRKKQALSEEPI